MNITLYKALELARLESHIDEETGEIDIAGFENSQIALADKQRAYVAVIKNRTIGLKMLDDAIADLMAKKKAAITQQAYLKDALMQSMVISNITKIEAIDGTFSASIGKGRESVLIEDGAIFDDSLCLPAKAREPSKELIKAAIEAGQPVAGARIITKQSLKIK
jgi:hypothetical protein